MIKMKRLLASCLGIGWLGIAPGTVSSLAVVVIFLVCGMFIRSAAVLTVACAAMAMLGSIVCLSCAGAAVSAVGSSDPREVVCDEFAGQAVVLLAVPAIGTDRLWPAVLLGFAFFRFFDIAKPWPVRKFEKLTGSWGILADDLAAAAYSAVLLLLSFKGGLVDYVGGLCTYPAGSSLGVFSSLVLGIVQGLTEFLPVSSSGHLVLIERLSGLDSEKPAMLLFDLAIHVATVAAIFIVFRRSIAAFLRDFFSIRNYEKGFVKAYRRGPAFHFLILAIVATAVTGVIGILFKHYFIAARGSLLVLSLMWIINGTLLIVTDFRRKSWLGLRRFGIAVAAAVGLAQAFAIMPGISRSGATICTAILLGLRRRWAVEFSFFIAIPAILGATVVQLLSDFEEISSADLPVVSVLTGSAAAVITGLFALKLLIRFSRRAKMKFLGFYCYILSVFTLIYLLR